MSTWGKAGRLVRGQAVRALLGVLVAASAGVTLLPAAPAYAATAVLTLKNTTTTPGATLAGVGGSGFGKSERVDIRLDSGAGQLLTTFVTTSKGSWRSGSVPIPTPQGGGPHTLYGIGQRTLITATGSFVVKPIGSITPTSLKAGDTTTFSGLGFVPGETVSVAFPGGTSVSAIADATGSVTAELVTPPEPASGGVVTASAPSGVATSTFSTVPRLTVPASAQPRDSVPVSMTGFGALESVNVSLDAGPTIAQLPTDGFGSANGTVAISTTFGTHTVTAAGAISSVTKTATLPVPATLSLSPTEGLPGTVVNVSSAFGWVSGETVQLFLGNANLQSLVADATGSVNATFTIPQLVPGSIMVKLSDSVLGVTAQSPFIVLDTTCSPNFVPADAPDLVTRMNNCPDGTTFAFAAGLYRISAQLPLGQGDTLIGAGSGAGGTEFRGSVSLQPSTFVQSGSVWTHSGDAKSIGTIPDPCAPGVQGCGSLDWVYRDGTPLSRVLGPCTTLAPDQFCVDYANNLISLGQDPTGHLIEYTVIQSMVISGTRASNVTIRNLAYSEFGSGGSPIAASTGWLIDGVRGYQNHGCGASALGAPATAPAVIQNSQFDHNGYHGVCDYPFGTKILNNDIGFNNAFFAHGTGIKLHGSTGLIQGNYIHDNNGVGIGFGFQGGSNATHGEQVVGNTIGNNAMQGLQMSNTCNDLIDSNILTANGRIQIDLQDSNTNTISNNTVIAPSSSTYGGIRVSGDTATGTTTVCGAWNDARNNQVTGNDISMGPGNTGNVNGAVSQPGALVSGEVFSGNTYHVPNGDCTARMWTWWDGSVQQDLGFSTWQSAGLDAPPATCGS